MIHFMRSKSKLCVFSPSFWKSDLKCLEHENGTDIRKITADSRSKLLIEPHSELKISLKGALHSLFMY